MTISADDILAVTNTVTKEWAKQRKAEERGKSPASREYIYSDRVYFTEVVDDILPGAYAHASGDGTYPVSKRQLYYACREEFKERTDRELEYDYFAGTLLVQYLNRHPEAAEEWSITADPRGTLTIPNGAEENRIPCGTVQIDDHLREAGRPWDPFDNLDALIDRHWPSLAGGVRYHGVLYIEKEGFGPLIEAARIAERFDLAVMSCKGQSVVAARKFVDQVCRLGGGVKLLVVHDLDKAGFEISQRLTTVSDWAVEADRVAYEFQNDIDVVDLGLRLADAEKYGLLDKAERCKFKGHFAADSIATQEERDFLRSGQRIELNAFTSPQFIEWLEAKVKEHLPKRLIPDDDVLADAYRRALAVARMNQAIEDVSAEAVEAATAAKIPASLRKKVADTVRKFGQAWDVALYDLAEAAVVGS